MTDGLAAADSNNSIGLDILSSNECGDILSNGMIGEEGTSSLQNTEESGCSLESIEAMRKHKNREAAIKSRQKRKNEASQL